MKPRAPELLEEAFRNAGWRGELVAFSGVTDCYQPLEAAWKLTRGCLEVCARFRNPVAILTKSALVSRDIDLLARLARESHAAVFLSIPFLDDRFGRKLEPGAPPVARRFEAMRRLAHAGIPVGIAVSPIIPGINDSDIPGLLLRANEAGARRAFRTLLRLPGHTRDVFLQRLDRDLPERAGRVRSRLSDVRDGRLGESRFGSRQVGRGAYWEAIDATWKLWTRRLGFDDNVDEAGPHPAFRRPPRLGGTLPLPFGRRDARTAGPN